MNYPNLFQTLGCIILLATCTACNSKTANQAAAKKTKEALPSGMNSEDQASNIDQQVIILSPTDETLLLDDVELLLEVSQKEPSELPELIEVRYRNKSSQKKAT